jgi:mgtE-like transporter
MNFSKALRETFTTYAFDLAGLLAGFILGYQLHIFEQAPWVIALYPAVLGAKRAIDGLLSGRLSTALHLGIVHPRFSKNTKTFYNLVEAFVFLTLITSVAISAFSVIFASLWGISFVDFPSILVVVMGTMTLGLALLAVTIEVSFFSFKRGIDPDTAVFPIMSAIATIFVTLCYFMVLTLFFSFGNIGTTTSILLGVANLLLVLYIIPKKVHEAEFVKTIRESLASLMIVAVIVNVTGTLLKGISRYANTRIEFYTIYPSLISLVSDVGTVVGSSATTKLALGMLKPKLSSLGHHAKNIFGAWITSLAVFIVLAFAGLWIHGTFTLPAFYSHLAVLLVTNLLAVTLIVVFSYATAILTFQKGLDPGNFVIPIENAFAATIASFALLFALAVLNLISVI